MGQKTERPFVPRTPRSRSAVWLCRFPFFFRPSLAACLSFCIWRENFSFVFLFCPVPCIVTLHNHSIVKLYHAFVLHCFGALSYLSPFMRRFAALVLLMLCLSALLPLSLLSLFRLCCPVDRDPVVLVSLHLHSGRLSRRGSRVVRSLAR